MLHCCRLQRCDRTDLADQAGSGTTHSRKRSSGIYVHIAGDPGSTASLNNFPYETWVSVSVTGDIVFTSEMPAPGVGANYQFPGRAVGPTGIYDSRNDTPWALNLSVMGAIWNNGNFGLCGGTAHVDTALISGGLVTVRRGQMLFQYSYDCDPRGFMTCHTIPSGQSQTINLKAIPVSLKASSDVRAVNFATTTTDIRFKAFPSPATLFVENGTRDVKLTTTFWQWIGADLTRAQVSQGTCAYPSGPATSRTCLFHPLESGRMVVKAYLGGYEQASSVSVQCLMPLTDPYLNDSTNDFQFRTTLLDALAMSNPDSAPGLGATAQHAGFRHEESGIIWHLPDNTYTFTHTIDSAATECHSNALAERAPGATYPPQPVPGAYPVSIYHTHPEKPGDPVYGCSGIDPNHPMWSQYPGDSLPVQHAGNFSKAGGGSGAHLFPADTTGDWPIVEKYATSMYVIQKDGTVWRLDPGLGFPKKNNPNHWSAFGTGYDGNHPAGKCTWAKPYKA